MFPRTAAPKQSAIRPPQFATQTHMAIFGHVASYVRSVGHALASEPGIVVVLNTDPVDRSQNAGHLPPFDVALIDIDAGLTSTGAQIRILKDQYPQRPIIGVTACDAIKPICQAIESGASGVMHRSDFEYGRFDFQSLGIEDSRATLSPRIARLLLNQFRDTQNGHSQPEKTEVNDSSLPFERNHDLLSPRECEVLRLSAAGLVGREIAGILSVSPHTITTHFKNIYRKLEVNTRGEAVFRAHCEGLI